MQSWLISLILFTIITVFGLITIDDSRLPNPVFSKNCNTISMEKKCEACSKSATKLTDEEIECHLKSLEGWSILTVGGIKRLHKSFSFHDFKEALAFTNEIGKHAEVVGHHPALLTEWGKTTVEWWSHSMGGLHEMDFACAKETDKCFKDG
eukprot:GCRY01001001.1.p1 GENE.GCRY01001001.1~~GCRY01001001.1.p1  ORF type:complete len:164 (+),score=13.33 GCRY01001001.1:40-492(+)